MSANRLREAARVLRGQAESATPGPWGWHEYGRSGRTLSTPGPVIGGCSTHELNVLKTTDDWPPTDDDARYIATMHPGVAMALADWLDDQADRAAENEAVWESGKRQYPKAWEGRTVEGNVQHHYAHPLTVADLILGSAS